MKQFNFEDGSFLVIDLDKDGCLEMVLQAKHVGEEFKITSTSVKLSPDNVNELVNWLVDKLAGGI
jgi:hypothetical protein